MSVIIILAVLAIVYSIMGVLLVKFGLRGLQCTRAFSRAAVFEGDEGEMIEIVRNDRPMFVPWLRVESHIPRVCSWAGSERRRTPLLPTPPATI